MDRPKLSICIPTYNRADHLGCVLEHLAFTVDWSVPVEIVVSDNASTDDTGAVIDAARSRLPALRSWRQDQNVSAEANVFSVLRRARGELSIYLADDDELLPERLLDVLSLFERDPGLAACYCPWESWNARDGVGLGPFYSFDGPRTFDSPTSLQLFEFVIQNGVFPEIGVFRTEAIQRSLFLPHRVHWSYVLLFRLLSHGAVRFEPEPYYRHVVVARDGLSTRSQVGVAQAVDDLDVLRGGLELGLLFALQSRGIFDLSRELRTQAHDAIEGFMSERAAVASRVCAGRRDFVGAAEFFARGLLWSPNIGPQIARDWQDRHLPLAAFQTLAETVERTAGVSRLVLCGIDGGDGLAENIRSVHPDLVVESRSADAVVTSADIEELLVVTSVTPVRDELLRAGFDSGRLILWGELTACLQVFGGRGEA